MHSTPAPSVWLSLCSLTAFVLWYFVIYPAFFSPLCKIPDANPLARYTGLWIFLKRYNQLENKTLHEAHQKIGPVVRVGPNEVSVNSIEGLKTIYGGNFDKHAWYANVFRNYFIENTFCMTTNAPHRERKRLFANIYSKSHLQNSKEVLQFSKTLLFDRLLPIFQTAAEKDSTVDILELGAAVGMDWTCAFLFGLNAGSNFIGDVKYRKYWLDRYEETKKYFTEIAEGYVIPLVLLNKIGIKYLPDSVLNWLEEMGEWNLEMCKKTQEAYASGKTTGRDKAIVFEQMARKMEKADQENLSPSRDMIIASEMLDQILAGHETSAVTMTYIMYELSKRPDLQAKLRVEVRTLSPRLNFPQAPEDLPPMRSIDQLPLLDAIFRETLRRYPAAAGSEPRVTPPGSTTIGNFTGIPGGVRISANQYTLHRHPKAFPNFEEWKPERWLDADKEQEELMNKWFWAFGSGPRMCSGIYFATQGKHSRPGARDQSQY